MNCTAFAPTVALIALSANAQSPAAPDRFEVASVKPYKINDGNFLMRSTPGGKFSAIGVTLNMLMMWAYNVRAFQIVGAPRWAGTELWEIQAETEHMEGRLPVLNERAAVRVLLEDRYKLQAHRETQMRPVYALVKARSQPRLAPASGNQFRSRPSWGSIVAEKGTMARLANELSTILWRPVINETGLSGEYAFKLEWTPEPGQLGPEAYGLPPGDYPPGPERVPPGTVFKGPDIFTALKDQLGLELKAKKGPAEVLVIDYAERASAN